MRELNLEEESQQSALILKSNEVRIRLQKNKYAKER